MTVGFVCLEEFLCFSVEEVGDQGLVIFLLRSITFLAVCDPNV